jgi:serine/threonine-protein kinase RsbW
MNLSTQLLTIERTLDTVTGPDTLAKLQHTLDAAWAAEEVPEYTRMCMVLAVSEPAQRGHPVGVYAVVDEKTGHA